MPTIRRWNLGRRTRHSTNMRNFRRTQSLEQLSQPNSLRNTRRNRSADRNTNEIPINPASGRLTRIRRAVQEMENAAFAYNSDNDYSAYGNIGGKTVICPHCDAAKPRIPLIPTNMPFEFKRLQFPARLSFAMSINKAQGQTLQVCGLSLEQPCFSHGQLYVACSRVGIPSNLFFYAPDEKIKNIVYQNVLD